jgi:ParB family chromosome partitioning protein
VTAPPRKPRLGGGLDALLPSVRPREAPGSAQGFVAPIEDVHPNRGQPRKHFDEAALAELTESIRELGVLEPILVRRRAAGGYEIIAGERRWRAAQRAGLREVPVFVRDAADKEAFEAALVENLQREDLNPLEVARAYQRLVDEHGHTQETVAKRVGKDRSTVANALRLLKLPESVLGRIAAGELSEGHGRALLAAGDARVIERLALAAVRKQWSVRETERQARDAAGGKKSGGAGGGPAAASKSANVRDLELRLSRALGTRVSVDESGPGKGKITVPYASLDELDRLLDKLLG